MQVKREHLAGLELAYETIAPSDGHLGRLLSELAEQAKAAPEVEDVLIELMELLLDRWFQNKCGCKHPACNTCKEDAEIASKISELRQK